MKYPIVTKESPDGVGWRVQDADGTIVARVYVEADANTIRDAMNKCAPPTLEDRPVNAFDCWGYAIGVKSKPFNAEADRDAAFRAAEMLGTRPIRGRFIPDNATAEQVYAEVARLLNMLEPKVNSPSVVATAHLDSIPIEYEADREDVRLAWDGPGVDSLVEALRTNATDHRDEADHDWDRMEADYRADADADARQSDAD